MQTLLIGFVLLSVIALSTMIVWLVMRRRRTLAAQRQRAAAQRVETVRATYATLQTAHAALFGTEYLAASDVGAWKQAHEDVLHLAHDPTWCQWLPPDEVPTATTLCDDLRDLSTTVQRHNDRFMDARLAEETDAFDRVERFPLTPRQRRAIVTNEDTTLVIAGAGTGKTSTIVGKVDYLLRRGLAAPDEILVLAYNRTAAAELRERLEQLGYDTGLQISTFHALGLQIVAAAQGRRPQVSSLTKDEMRLPFLQRCLAELWMDPAHRQRLVRFFAALLDEPPPAVPTASPTSPPSTFRTLTGVQVKSHQEVQIANWLTLHGVVWEYERPYEVNTATTERRQYRPDFYLPTYKLYLEHWGLDRQGRTRADIDQARYVADMAWKRDLHRTHGTTLLETFSYFADNEGLPYYLDRLLRAQGIVPQLVPWERLAALFQDQTTPANGFVKLLDQFLQLFNGAGADRAAVAVRARSPRDHAFLDIFDAVYARYQAELERTETLDFDAMINTARAVAQAGTYQSRFRYLIVDEFQDISRNRLGMLLDLRAQVPHSRLFVVGDDWQAIYRFAGSDVSLITHIDTHVGTTTRVDLDTTFRYGQELLDASAQFVTANPHQLRKTLCAQQGAVGMPPIVLVYQDDASPAGQQRAVERVAHAIREQHDGEKDQSVFVLGRYRRTGSTVMEYFARQLATTNLAVEFHTMHRAKGKEATYVLIAGLETSNGGFPSTIPDDQLVNLVLSDAETFAHAEERRLFYVALTRARKQVYVLVPPTQVSPFVTELQHANFAPYVTTLGECPERYQCPVCEQVSVQRHAAARGMQWLCVDAPHCSGRLPTCATCGEGAVRRYHRQEVQVYEQCTQCGATREVCPRCHNGILRERTGRHGRFLACSTWQNGAGCRYTRSSVETPEVRSA